MNIGEEKTFLYGMMKDITEERRRLTDMYHSLKDRLDTLYKFEEKGIGELSTKGFIDMFNDRETRLQITNVAREAQYTIEQSEDVTVKKELMPERYDKVAATLEQGQAERAAERAKKEAAAQEVVDRDAEIAKHNEGIVKRNLEAAEQKAVAELVADKERKEADRIAKLEKALAASEQYISRLQDDNNKQFLASKFEKAEVEKEGINKAKNKDKGRPKPRTDAKLTFSLIIDILKDANGPIKTADVFEKVNEMIDVPYSYKNFFNNVLHRAKQFDKNIYMPSTGHLEYKL